MDERPKILKAEDIDNGLDLSAKLDFAEFQTDADDLSERKIVSQSDLQFAMQGREILAVAHRKAQEVIDRAKNLYLQVEDKIAEAKAQGFEDGREEGLATVTETLVKIREENIQRAASYEKEALKLIYELARKIIGDAFKMSDENVLSMLREVLSGATGNEIMILLSPEDFERVKGKEAQLMSALHGTQMLNLRPVESVKPGSCIVESELGSIEADLETQLLALKKVLGIS